ncbi:MAG: phytanoyl-CoA dioxygenase family protein [Pseudomonadales bacterium]|nr:phytanoyl-CoA dioxygenase family protein [Pseudomonadales bacterium]
MAIPEEFTVASVTAASKGIDAPYRDFVTSTEPYHSLMAANPWMKPPKKGETLTWGEGRYYDTTVARKHPYWKNKPLPLPTKNISQLREDFHAWGYCLIEDATSPEQTKALLDRVSDQAAAERELGIGYLMEAQQHVWALVNKGEVFVRCMAHETSAVQAGRLIEQLLDETLGPGWTHLSFISNISYPECHPQGMHQDQSLAGPYAFIEAPFLVNTVYILQDVNEVNGGTLIIPGSHRLYMEGGGKFGEVPPPINLEAPAGTILLMDGRVLHGGAINRSENLRYIMTNSVVRPFIRQQESFHLTIRPDILKNASDKFLWRCGFQATASRSMVEGYGYFGNGREGDPNGSIVKSRIAMDEGNYQRVGELSLAELEGKLQELTLADIQNEHETPRGSARKKMRSIR